MSPAASNGSVAGEASVSKLGSEAQVSPRVSTVDTDEPTGGKKDHHAFFAPEAVQEFRDYSAPGLDSLHWAGVKKRGDFDQRSVASSMNAERDDKSIYEEPAIGAVEEAEEHRDQQGEVDDDDEEVTEEINLATIISPEPSNSTTSIRESGHMSHDDDRYNIQTSPRDGTRIAASSVAFSDVDVASIRPAPSEEDERELLDDAGPTSAAGSATHNISGSAAASAAASSAAASPRSPAGIPPSPLSRASADFESSHQNIPTIESGVQPYRSSLMRKITGMGDGAVSSSDAATDDMASVVATDGASAAPSLAGSVPRNDMTDAGNMMARGIVKEKKDGVDGVSTEQQQEGKEGNDDNIHNNDEDDEQQDIPAVITIRPNNDDEKLDDGDDTAITSMKTTATMQTAVEGPAKTNNTIINTTIKSGNEEKESDRDFPEKDREQGHQPSPLERDTESGDASAGVHNKITAALEVEEPKQRQPPPPPPQQQQQQQRLTAAIPQVNLGPEWENAFKGLLYVDGIDALGRPVVVLDADAVPSNMKSSALTYVKAHMEPLVTSGHYVIVFTARKATLPSFWIMGAYQTLPRPFRKNVQYLILVRPSGFLKAILAFMRPFVSKKAGRKIKTVDSLEEIAEATGGEVTVQHLGASFLEADARAAQGAAAAQP